MGVLLVFMFLVNALWRPVAAVGFFLLVARNYTADSARFAALSGYEAFPVARP